MSEGRATFGRRLLDGWIAIAGRFGAVQTLVLLAFFYLCLVGPVSLIQALGRVDHLDKRRIRTGGSAWRAADTSGADLERAKLQS